jgi:hypothetical protein
MNALFARTAGTGDASGAVAVSPAGGGADAAANRDERSRSARPDDDGLRCPCLY